MHELDLAALMVSRVCHDLISPVAAVSNGLEILADEQDPSMKEQAMALIAHSVGQAKARLLFARLAFGASVSLVAGSFAIVAGTVAPAHAADNHIKINLVGINDFHVRKFEENYNINKSLAQMFIDHLGP